MNPSTVGHVRVRLAFYTNSSPIVNVNWTIMLKFIERDFPESITSLALKNSPHA